MKPLPTLLATLLLSSATTPGALFISGTLDTIIPDGNPNGISSTINVSGLSPAISDVNVSINVSGGFNGDLYAFLSFGNGTVVLLNHIGNTSSDPFGSPTAGFGSSAGGWYNFKFDDSTLMTDIHAYSDDSGSPITGTYNTDRRTMDPQLVLDTSPRGSSLVSFNNSNPNGAWTIFFTDMAGGNDPSTLVSWGLEIEAVPEPTRLALGIFGILVIGVGVVRRWQTGAVLWSQRHKAISFLKSSASWVSR
jgi:subtilisin-like proprotein convertase family protein